ncbi:MAG: dihydroneopterin aldolase [Firmicutes bacterium]|nr:dihydroneopterin aldolase [Alicyclobacillaceae bacterium]MCL6497163.1 dihydroneopterin aldolase [Bacillota bacterium]
MADWIRLSNLRFQARHGAHPHEKRFPQAYSVDVGLRLDLGAAGMSDRIQDTVDYGRVVEAVRAVMEGPPRALLEALAEAIARQLLALPRVKAVTVRVRKWGPPLAVPLDWAEVEIFRARQASSAPGRL